MADAGTKFTEADLEKIVARIETERRQLKEELTAAETRQRMAVRALEASREELRGLQDQSATNPSATARATELVELRRTQLETAEHLGQSAPPHAGVRKHRAHHVGTAICRLRHS